MSVQTPNISIIGKIPFGGFSVSQSFSSGSSDYNGTPYVFSCTFEIVQQAGASPFPSTNPDVYNAYTIDPGFKFVLPSGKVYDVLTVSASSTTADTVG